MMFSPPRRTPEGDFFNESSVKVKKKFPPQNAANRPCAIVIVQVIVANSITLLHHD